MAVNELAGKALMYVWLFIQGVRGLVRDHPVWGGVCALVVAGIVAVGLIDGFRVVLYAAALVAVAAFAVWLLVSASCGVSGDD